MNYKVFTLILVVLAVLLGSLIFYTQLNNKSRTDVTVQSEASNSPSKAIDTSQVSNGFVQGKICLPSDAGYIQAKRLSDGRYFTKNFSTNNYSFELGPEKYHLRYVVGGIGDYATYSYNLQESKVVAANVESGKTLTYDMCQTSTTDLESF